VSTSLPAPPNRRAAGRAPLASFRLRASLPPWPKTWTVAVLATVGAPPVTATAPPLTRIAPAAVRLTTMVLFRASPKTDKTPAPHRRSHPLEGADPAGVTGSRKFFFGPAGVRGDVRPSETGGSLLRKSPGREPRRMDFGEPFGRRHPAVGQDRVRRRHQIATR